MIVDGKRSARDSYGSHWRRVCERKGIKMAAYEDQVSAEDPVSISGNNGLSLVAWRTPVISVSR